MLCGGYYTDLFSNLHNHVGGCCCCRDVEMGAPNTLKVSLGSGQEIAGLRLQTCMSGYKAWVPSHFPCTVNLVFFQHQMVASLTLKCACLECCHCILQGRHELLFQSRLYFVELIFWQNMELSVAYLAIGGMSPLTVTAAIVKYYRLEGYINRNLFSLRSEGQKFKVKFSVHISWCFCVHISSSKDTSERGARLAKMASSQFNPFEKHLSSSSILICSWKMEFRNKFIFVQKKMQCPCIVLFCNTHFLCTFPRPFGLSHSEIMGSWSFSMNFQGM